MDTETTNNIWWLLEVDLPHKAKYERMFPTEKEALIEHMYLESEGLDVSEWSIRQITLNTQGVMNDNTTH